MSEASLKARLMATLEQNVALETRVDELTHEVAQRTAELGATRQLQADLRTAQGALERADAQSEQQAQTIGNLNRQLAELRDSERQARVHAEKLAAQVAHMSEDNDGLQRSVRTYSSEAQRRNEREKNTKARDSEVEAIVAEARASLAELGNPAVTPETLDAALALALNAALNNDLEHGEH